MTEGTENHDQPVAEEPLADPAAEQVADALEPQPLAEQEAAADGEETVEVVEVEPQPESSPEPALAEEPVLAEEPASAEPEPVAAETDGETDAEAGSETPVPIEPESTDTEPEAEPEADDLEVAIAQASEKVVAEAPPAPRRSVPIWPFVVYDLLWLAFAGVLVWRFMQLPPGTAVFESSLYASAIIVGVALTAVGPVLIIITWIASWGRGAPKGELFVSAILNGAVATALGVMLWWGALIILDQLRLGRLL